MNIPDNSADSVMHISGLSRWWFHGVMMTTVKMLDLLFTSCQSLGWFLLSFFLNGLEQSAVQLFRELSNPALDLSRAARPNRIVVLTLMTIPPAVAEPPVGLHEQCARGRGQKTEQERDGHRQTACLRDALSLVWNNHGSRAQRLLECFIF